MSEKYKVGDPRIPHFITSTVIDWVDLFTRPHYKDILIDSLKFGIEQKGLVVHAYCIMSNHIHLIVSTTRGEKLNEIIRDFKKYTSKELTKSIKSTRESRKVWLLRKFLFAGRRIRRNKKYKIWKDGFHPVELNTNGKIRTRLNYVHENPVKAGLVYEAEDYVYSSASYYAGREGLLKVELL